MGILRGRPHPIAVSPNGRTIARHDLTTDDLLGGLRGADRPIRGLPPEVEHASGGPLLHDPATETIIVVYHGETFHGGDPMIFWSFLGMAVSTDHAETFTDLGPIITAPGPTHADAERGIVEVGGGGFVLREGWMQVYSGDRGTAEVRTQLGVARCRVDAVLESAARGAAPVFEKYLDGAWGSPGLGGEMTDLLASNEHRAMWFDAALLETTGQTLIVFSTVGLTAEEGWGWTHMGCVSHDGIEFDEPQQLYPAVDDAQLLYLSLDAPGSSQRCIAADWFHLYRVRSTTAFRWDDACLERVTVHIEMGATPADQATRRHR